MKFSTIQEVKAMGVNSRNPDYVPKHAFEIYAAWPVGIPVSGEGDAVYFANAFLFEVSSSRPGKKDSTHLVVLAKVCTGDPETGFTIYCGDGFLEGKSVDTVAVAESVRDHLQDFNVEAELLNSAMENLVAKHESIGPSDACNFWIKLKETAGLCGCKHVGHVLTHLVTDEHFQRLQQAEADLLSKRLSEPAIDNFTDAGLDEIDLQIEEDLGVSPSPIMLIGEAGASKTWRAQQYAVRNNLPYFEIGGNADVRPTDLTGHYVKVGDSLIWMDGVFTEAIRAAQTQKVVFCADEFFRMDPDNATFFLSRMNPRNGKYYHRTGFLVDVEAGRGRMEEISCPVENLLIIATTNLGSKYGIVDRDPAIRRRFREIEVPLTQAHVVKVCAVYVKEKGWPVKIAQSLGLFWSKMKKLSDTTASNGSLIAEAPNLGVLARAITKAISPEDIIRQLEREILQWVSTTADGYAIKEQVEDVKKIIKATIK